ncbi:MAG TPA: Crp/Fnr family transcriptional regulator [Kofleriaceae bacterium]|nr:Crp/Fnr family transcriptional regulator [Kofleriaceae bacterium]
MTDKAAILAAAPLFREADAATIAKLARAAREIAREEGETIWDADAPALDAVLIVRGLVEIARNDATLALFGPRELIGLPAALEGGAYPAAAIAVAAEVRAIAVPAVELRAAVDRDHALARAANRALIDHGKVLRAKIAILTAGSIEQRLAALFEHLAERFGDEVGGELRIPLTLTRRMIAQLVGARVETVIRALAAWRRAGLADAGVDIVIRDRAALRHLLA